MPTKVIIPKLGLTMQKGTVVGWKTKEGDTVEKGKALFSIDTEKVTVDIESPASGVLKRIFAPVGSTVAVGGLVAIISEPNEVVSNLDQLAQEAEKAFIRRAAPQISATQAQAAPTRRERMLISPLARKLAEEHELDVSKLVGTGPGGRIQKEDVLRAVELMSRSGALGQPTVATVIPLSMIRLTMIERLAQSYSNALHVTLQVETDFSELVKLRQKLAQQRGRKVPSCTDLLVKAVALALRENRLLNSMIEDEQIKIFEDINIGIAVSVESGLVVPVVRNADLKKIDDITNETENLVERARKGQLTLDDVAGGTFTITNLGMYDIDSFSPIINPPQAAILAVGRIAEKPAVVQGRVDVKPMAMLALTFDHRIADGAQASQFMKTLSNILSSPQLLQK